MKALAKVLRLNVKTLINARAKSLQEITGVIQLAKRTPLDAQQHNTSQESAPKSNRNVLLNNALDINPDTAARKQEDQSNNVHGLRHDVLEVARKLNNASQIDTSIIDMMVTRMIKAEEADKQNF